MALQRASLAVTERYRAEMLRLRRSGTLEARRTWAAVRPADLDATYDVATLALWVEQRQRAAARASSAYLAAFVASELGEETVPLPADYEATGKTYERNELRESLRNPMIGVKVGIASGKTPAEALATNRERVERMVALAIDTAGREALRSGIEADERIEGWQRAVGGTCGACLGDVAVETSVELPSIPIRVHPYCQCVTEPYVVRPPRAVEAAPRPSGRELFERMSATEQDEALSPPVAAAVRAGEVELADLVRERRIDGPAPNFIAQASAAELGLDADET